MSQRWDADVVKAVLLLGTGWTKHDAAEALLLDEKTVARYVERYRQNSRCEEFWRMDYQGSGPTLSEHQLAQLDQHLQSRVYLTVAALVSYVEQRFGVSYSEQGMTELLHWLDFAYKKPKTVGGKADAAAQQAFVGTYKKLKNCREPGDPIYFMDGVHPQHNSIPAYGWIKKDYVKEMINSR